MSSASTDNFTSTFLFWMAFVFFFCLIALDRIPILASTTLNKRGNMNSMYCYFLKTVLREKFILINVSIKKNISNKQVKFIFQVTTKIKINKPSVCRKKRILKMRARINEIQTRKTIENINKTRWAIGKYK